MNPLIERALLTKEEFCQRFTAKILRLAGRKIFDDGRSIKDYAAEAGSTYWDDPDQRVDGPEECAEADVGYWE